MSRDDASVLKRNKAGSYGGYACDGNTYQQPLRSRKAATREASSSRPRTVLVMTGTLQARETGVQCVNMLANAGHRVVAVLDDGDTPDEFIKGPVADRIACLGKEADTDATLRTAIGALPERFRQIDALVGMVCIQSSRSALLQKGMAPCDIEPKAGTRALLHAVRAVLPSLSASRRGHAIAVLER